MIKPLMGVFRSLPDDVARRHEKPAPKRPRWLVRMSPYDHAEYRDLTHRLSRLRAVAAPLIRRLQQLRRRYRLDADAPSAASSRSTQL